MKTSTINDVNKLALTIEALAKEVQNKVAAKQDVLSTANELVRNNMTLVFALGEVSAMDQIRLKSLRTKDPKSGRFVKNIKT